MLRKKIKTNLSVLVVANAVATALPLLTFPFITRALGPEMYGKYGFAMGVVGFFMLLAAPGFTTYGTRAVAQETQEAKVLASKLTGLRLLFAFAAFLLLAVYTFAWAPTDPAVRLLIFAASLGMLSNALSLDWLLTGASEVVPLAASNIVGQVVYTAAVLWFLSSPQRAWVIPVAAFAGAAVTISISYYVVWRRFGLMRPSLAWRDFREIVPTTLLFGFSSLMCMTYDKVDSILLGYFRPMQEVGFYAANYRLMGVAMSFLPILTTVFGPLVAKALGKDQKAGHEESSLYLDSFFVLAFPLIAGGVVLSEPLTSFVLGKDFTGSGLLFSLLLPNVLFGGLAMYYSGMRLLSLNRNGQYVAAVTAGALLNVGLNLFAIPLWGACGAAVTTCLAQATVAGTAAWCSRDCRGPRLLPAARAPLLASAGMVLVLAAVMALWPGLPVLLLVLLGALAYGLVWAAAKRSGRLGRADAPTPPPPAAAPVEVPLAE